MTRTHTVYFSEDTLAEIWVCAETLNADWKARGRYMHGEVFDAGNARLQLLANVLSLLAEPVPESFG